MNILKRSAQIIGLSLILLAVYHHLALPFEAKRLHPNGQMVTVNGHQLHLYTAGPKHSNQPTFVFIHGGATPNPVYDWLPFIDQFSSQYRVAMVEHLGYGYSQINDDPRGINDFLADLRSTLTTAGESGPYILIPHSMGALVAHYWAQQYPDEVQAIVGMDLAVPQNYLERGAFPPKWMIAVMRAGTWMGLQRLAVPFILDKERFSDEAYQQSKLLVYRNSSNKVIAHEQDAVLKNAQIVADGPQIDVPMLLFLTHEGGFGDDWQSDQRAYGQAHHATFVTLDASHAMFREKPTEIAQETLAWLKAQKIIH